MSVAKGETHKRRCCMCSKAHCSSITDSPAVSGAGGVGGGRADVASSETDTTEDAVAGMQGIQIGSTIRWISFLPHNSTLALLRVVWQWLSGSQTINVWFTPTHAMLVVSETVKEDRVDEGRERGTYKVSRRESMVNTTQTDMESKDVCIETSNTRTHNWMETHKSYSLYTCSTRSVHS